MESDLSSCHSSVAWTCSASEARGPSAVVKNYYCDASQPPHRPYSAAYQTARDKLASVVCVPWQNMEE